MEKMEKSGKILHEAEIMFSFLLSFNREQNT